MPDETTSSAPEAPAEWSTLFESLPLGAYRSRPDGRFVRANPAMVRLCGCRSESELIDAVHDIARDWYVHPRRRVELLAQVGREGSACDMVSEIRQPTTGRTLWVREDCHAVRGADGTILCYEGTVEDLTEQVVARRALEHSESLLREVIAGTPGMVYRVHVQPDGSQRYEYVSDGVRALYGVEPDEVIADPYLLRRLRHPQDQPRVQEVMSAHIASGEPCTVEFRIVKPRGRDVWVRLNSSVRREADGSARLFGVAIDVSDVKIAEQALAESDRRWTLALESLGDGVWDWNLATGEGYFSGPLRLVYGLPADHPMRPGEDLDERVHPDDRASMQRARQAHLEGCSPAYVHEHRLLRADGHWIWVLSRGIVVERDAAGKPLRMIGTHTDVTERREADALRRQRDRAEQADRTKSELMSRISHELRTPLNAILGFAQLLDMDADDGSVQQEWARHVLGSGRLLLALVDDVLELTSGHRLQFTMHLAPVDVAAAVRDCWWQLEAGARARRVTLDDADVDPALQAQADPKRLRQVLGNLLSNAVKYNRPGGRIAVAARRDGDRVIVSVADTGAGIVAEHLPRLFQPFDRLGAAHGEVPGTGLGLALCKQLVEAMGGDISVASEPGQGSCFSVRLAAVADPAPSTARPPR